jgi:hypothetical protein
MKRLKFVLILLFCLVVFSGCDIIVKKAEIKDSIVGTWYRSLPNMKQTFIFYPNGTGIFTEDNLILNFTYKINGEKLEIRIFTGSGSEYLPLKTTYICGDVLIISEMGDIGFYRTE